ncbi:MAG: hypothetical protein WA180_17800 [Candidatus Sulfotelmatobacter sp.]
MAAPRWASVALPKSGTTGRGTNAELDRLEKQNAKIVASKNATTTPKAPVKPAVNSSSTGSGINASYQKPRVTRK